MARKLAKTPNNLSSHDLGRLGNTFINSGLNASDNISLGSNSQGGGSLASGNYFSSGTQDILNQLNMFDKSWGKSLLNKISTAIKTGNDSIEISLRPKSLGRMKVTLSISGDGAKINIITETPGAALLLSEAEGKLSQMLETAGVKLSNLNTSSEHGKKEKSNNGREDQLKDGEASPAETTIEENQISVGSGISSNLKINVIA